MNTSRPLAWGDEALAEAFYRDSRLKVEVKDEISKLDPRPTAIAEMINQAIRIDNRLYERQLERRQKGRPLIPNSGRKRAGSKNYDPVWTNADGTRRDQESLE